MGKKSSSQGKGSRNIWAQSERKQGLCIDSKRRQTVCRRPDRRPSRPQAAFLLLLRWRLSLTLFGDNTCYTSSASSDAEAFCNRLHPGNLKASHISSFFKSQWFQTTICTCLEEHFYLGYNLITYRQSSCLQSSNWSVSFKSSSKLFSSFNLLKSYYSQWNRTLSILVRMKVICHINPQRTYILKKMTIFHTEFLLSNLLRYLLPWSLSLAKCLWFLFIISKNQFWT